MKNYYGLVASMPDVSPDDAKLSFTVRDFKEDWWPELSAADKKTVSLFFLRYDNRNLLAWLADGEGAAFDERAMFPREAWPEAMEKVKTGEEQGRTLPPYLYEFIAEYPALKEAQERLPEDVLSAAYYRHAGSCGNRFAAEWFAFNRNVSNILTALTARKYGFSPAPYLVGDDTVTKALAVSGARDFGLGSELDYVDDVMRIHEAADPTERERKLDLLKWEWLEDRTFFCYFSVERLFALLVKTDIIERWTRIDKEQGGKVFRGMVERLRDEVEVPRDFR